MLQDVTLKPASGGKPRNVVILLHGVGDCGEGLISLGEAWQAGMPDTEFVAPNAPFPCDMAPFGYQWFSLQTWTTPAILAGVERAAPLLDSYIDHVIETRGVSADRVALVGFSQGTIMSLYVAPRREKQLAGVLGYSGALYGGDTLRAQRKSSPPVLLVHGTMDDVVPFSALEHAEQGLKEAGINVSTIACPGLGHGIDNIGLSAGLSFLQKVLA